MYHRQLVTHVTQKLTEGVPESDIRAELERDGWSNDDITQAFYYSAFPDKLNHFSIGRMLHSQLPTWVTGSLLCVAIVLIVGISLLSGKQTLSYNITLTGGATKPIAFSYGEQPALANPDFFEKTKKELVAQKTSFIEANLSTMQLHVYKNGEPVLEVPIDTKGRKGSWWETPAGLYKVQLKKETHFSSIGRVYMPWSLNFQGNFFIHGHTYYPDGTQTSSQFTGGCIRLSTADAEKVYDLAETGMPVLVFENSFSSDKFTYEPSLTLTASSYLAADIGNNQIFAHKNSTAPASIASLTKLMTALVAAEFINLDKQVTVPQMAIATTSRPRLHAGDTVSVYQLLFPLLMESSNEAAEAIAYFYGRKEFVRRMNEKAASIGMTSTRFVDPSGVSADNTSTAEDMFLLIKYIYNNRSFIFKITSGNIGTNAYGSHGFSDLTNLNYFANEAAFVGGKNGKSTAAQETNISVFKIPVKKTERPLVFIVLDSVDSQRDTAMLRQYTMDKIQ